MTIVMTIRLTADTKTELINTFGAEQRNVRAHFEALKAQGAFGEPDKVRLAFLLTGGRHLGLDETPS